MKQKSIFKIAIAFVVVLALLLPGSAVFANFETTVNISDNNSIDVQRFGDTDDDIKETSEVLDDPVDWWPMFHHDPEHSGYSESLISNDNSIVWKYATDGKIRSSPAIYNDKVYISSGDKKLYCLDAETGDKIWSYTTGDEPGWLASSPAIYADKVYIGSTSANVYCLNADSGDLVWKYAIPSGCTIESSPTIANGKVYIASRADGVVYCLNAFTGDFIWKFPIGYQVLSSPAIFDGKVYIVGNNDVYCVNGDTGNEIWVTYGVGYGQSSPAIYNDKVYRGGGSNVYCLDAETGDKIWWYGTGIAHSSPAVAYDKVYIGSWNYQVSCVDAETGGFIWEYVTSSHVHSSPAVADGKVYIGSCDCNVYCLNADSGDKIWRYPTGGPVYSSPAIANGKVYVGSDDGNIYCFGSPPDHDAGVKEIIEPSGPPTSVEIFSENFDGNWTVDPDGDSYMVPEGWDIDGICTGSHLDFSKRYNLTHYWSMWNDSMPYFLTRSSPNCVTVGLSNGWPPDPPDFSQDEWLITPELDVSAYGSLQLEFYSVYPMAPVGISGALREYVKASTDGGATWDVLGDLCHDNEFYFPYATGGLGGKGYNWNEFPVVINLSAYAGSDSLMVAWNFKRVPGVGFFPSVWSVDDVVLSMPLDGTWLPGEYPIEAVVKNYGLSNESGFIVNATIYKMDKMIYHDDVVVTTSMNYDDEVTVTFRNITFGDADVGDYRLEVTTELDMDENPYNDQEIMEFTIEIIDAIHPAITLERQDLGLIRAKFIANVSDPLPSSGIDRVEFYLDNELQETFTEASYVTNGSYEWNYTGFGSHTVLVIAYDNAGNSNSISMAVSHSQSHSQSISSVLMPTALADIKKPVNKNLSSGALEIGDILFEYDVQTPTGDFQCVGVEFDGTYFYVTGGGAGGTNKIHIFQADGTYILSINQGTSTYWGWYDIVYDGNHMYSADETGGMVEWYVTGLPVNPVLNVVGTVPDPITPCMALAYDPGTDHFWTAEWNSDLFEFDRKGNIINRYMNTYDAIGMAWDAVSPDGPWLWIYSYDGEPMVLISQFDPVNGVYTGVTYHGVYHHVDGCAGGACFIDYWNGKALFVGLTQNDPDSIFGMEICDANPLPEQPVGPTKGALGVEYIFSSSAIHPEGEQIYYKWCWGDGTFSKWLGPFDSGVNVETSHSWNEIGEYKVRVKIKDASDVGSGWSDQHIINIVDEPIIEIGSIRGGLFRIRAVIKNTGSVDASGVNWSIMLDGDSIRSGKESSGKLASIPAGGEVTVRSGSILGFGKTMVTVVAEIHGVSSDAREQDALVLLFFIMMIRDL